MSDLSQYIFSGLSVGCIYAFVALGLVIVSNVTGVFNFATGEYVMLGGMITAVTLADSWPIWLAAVVAVVGVSAIAVVQERLTVAPVRGKVGALGLVIASLGVGVVIRGAVLLIWQEDVRSAPPFEAGLFKFLGASLANEVKWIYLSTAVALVLITLLFTKTNIGRAMRASAINPVAARLTGIRIGTTSMASFAIAGALCGLIATVSVSTTLVKWDSGVTVGLIGFIAAALAGFNSPVKAVLAGLALGVVESVSAGLISSDYRQAIVYGTLIVYLLARDYFGEDGTISRAIKGRRASSAGSEDAPELREQIKARVHAVEDYVRTKSIGHDGSSIHVGGRLKALMHRRPTFMMMLPAILLVLAAFFPMLTDDIGMLDAAVFILLAAMAATGLGLVMGLTNQFSLGQAVFVLISGYTAAILTADHGWNPFAALLVAVALSVAVGFAIGWLTLRLEGLNLALATLAILVIALVFVARQKDLTHGNQGVQGVSPFEIFGLTIEEPKDFFLLSLGILAVMLLIARNVWKSRMGRDLRAIGIDQEAAESIGLNAWRLKLKVFVLSAAMAGVAGVLWTYYLQYASPDSWGVKLTIDLVTFVVVGGVISPFGGAVGAVVVGALQYLIRQNIATGLGGDSSMWEVVFSGLLLVLFVLVFKKGLVSIPRLIGDRLQRGRGEGGDGGESSVGVSANLEPHIAEAGSPPLRGKSATQSAEPLRSETALVVVEGLTKRFGSLAAVSDLSFSLRPGYITALIGPNGAGKTTVINMLAGTLLPSDGAVGVMGRPVVGLRSKDIAQLGLARTFQTPRLFDGMTVLETVMLARDRYGSRAWLTGAALRTPRARRDEVEAREQALAWLAYLGLEDDADTLAVSLTTGKQRIAELARALATEPTVMLLDEPAAGLDGAETRALAITIREIANAGIAVLLVEHDMGMVMSIADHIVVLESGRKISEGSPSEVGNDQTVIDAYLGVVPV
ncbi:MAG: ATP-binding cassette domain-containing protein [Actinomycetota bacterium]